MKIAVVLLRSGMDSWQFHGPKCESILVLPPLPTLLHETIELCLRYVCSKREEERKEKETPTKPAILIFSDFMSVARFYN